MADGEGKSFRIEHQLTFEEYVEASGAQRQEPRKLLRRQWDSAKIVQFLVVFVLICLAAYIFLIPSPAPTTVFYLRAQPGNPPTASSFSGQMGQTRNTSDLIKPHMFWISLLFIAAVMLRMNMRRVLRLSWDNAPVQHPWTYTFDDSGVTWSSEETTARSTWFAFKKFRETWNLFLLFNSDVNFHIIPKRSFANLAVAAEFKAFVEAKLSERTIRAFPVIPRT